MPAYFFAFAERFDGNAWHLAAPLEPDPDRQGALVPKNIAPPWGWEQIVWYAELTGERGLPDDISDGLSAYIAADWHGEALGHCSWATVAEMKRLLAADTSRLWHFNPDWITNPLQQPDPELRAVFWHD